MVFYSPVALRRRVMRRSVASVDRYCDKGTFMALAASHGYNVDQFGEDYIIYPTEAPVRRRL
jgi:hypothetical protein